MTNAYPKGITILDDDAEKSAYSKDNNIKDGYTPKAIARLKNSDEVVDLVRWANLSSTPLIPVSSSGSRRRGDTVPAVDGAVIADLSGLRGLKNADERDRVAIIEPGVDFSIIDELLKPSNLRALRPLKPRKGKSVLASYLDREPFINPDEHWDASDPLGGASIVLGNGDSILTGGAALEGSLEDQLGHGHRHVFSQGPHSTDMLRVVQGSQGSIGMVTWAAIMCEPIPSIEKSWFACSDSLDAVTGLARDLLHRRIGNVLFIVDAVQLALLLGKNTSEFEVLSERLPAWALFTSIRGTGHNPSGKIQWQSNDLTACAKTHGVSLHEAIEGFGAQNFAADLRKSEDGAYQDRAYGAHKELFFMQSFSGLNPVIEAMRANTEASPYSNKQIGTYIQPMTQGVNLHVEFTMPYDSKADAVEQKNIGSFWETAVKTCADYGAYFSRPYGEWKDLAFESHPDVVYMMSKAKGILDPNDIMNPNRLPYGSF